VTSGTPSIAPNWDPDIVNGVLPPGVIAPFGITNTAIMLGSNPDLTPEEADTWQLTAGFAHEELDISLTYWNIEYDDQILFPGSIPAYLGATPADVPAFGGNYGGWESLIIPVYNPVTCDNSDFSTADPVLQPFLESLNYDFISGGGSFSSASSLQNDFCKVNVIIDSRIQNIGSVEKSGIDFNVSYAHDIGEVNLLGQLATTYYLKNDYSAQPGVPPTEEIGDLASANSVFEWSGTASVTALWQSWDSQLVLRYLDGMLASNQLGADGLPGPDRNISAYTQFDLTVGYSAESGGFLKSWRAQLAITNLFDQEPDFFVMGGTASGSSAWDYKYGLPFGRTYSLQLTTTF
jgi:outer membrane receptor for ferrienterochelin and colicin